jgi:crotonobetaine/carnitine-CoA ligase
LNKLDLSKPEDRIFPLILRRQAQDNGATEFLVNDDQRITFAQAEDITNRLATGLQQRGVRKGDRVCLYMGSHPEMVLLTLALNKLGAIWIPINTDYKGEWLLDTIRRSRCCLLATDAEYQQRYLEVADQLDIPEVVVVGGDLPAGAHSYAELAACEPLQSDYADQDYGDTCAILWTSGTTGKSKGVMQNYNGWIRAIFQGASILFDSQPGDVIYCAMPLFNTGAWVTAVYRALLEGIPCVIEPKFSVTVFWDRVKQFGATQTFLIGAMGVFLWNAPETEDDADNPMRVMQVVPFPPDLWEPFEQRFGVQLSRCGLGQSECQLVTTQPENRDDVPVYALGFPPADVDIRLFDDDGNEVPDGEPGEICIRPLAPHILFNGYFDDPDNTANAFRGDWYLTGDMGRKDPTTGAFFFVDRKKDALRYAGRNISTMEVESVVRRHPAIADVAAFGIPSQEVESEHELKLNVVLKEGAELSAEALCEFINDNAPYYFVPRYLDFVDALPYTPTNKVQKFKLREEGVSDATWDLKKSGYTVKR